MKKVLFLIHDLGRGGAEKVLVNLVNHLNQSLFEIHVIALFGGGVNEQFLNSNIHFRQVYKENIPANSKWMKLFTPKQLHKMYIRDHYDIEISYLEGPCARIISGCEDTSTKLISWIHVEQHTKENASFSFRNYQEALSCYSKFDNIVCVSDFVKRDFNELIKNEKDEAGLYLKTVNLVCNGLKLLGTFDPKMLSNEYEINTEKYKKLINDLTKKLK